MALTFGNAISDVASYINQDLSDDTKTVTATEVKRWINTGYKKMQNAILTANQDYYLQESYASLVASQSTYTLPTDTLKLQRVEIGFETATDRRVAEKISMNSIREDEYTGSTGEPFFTVYKNLVKLYPTPSISVTNGLRLWYYPQLADLTLAADTFDLPLGYEYLPALFAASRAKDKLGLFDEGRELMNEYEAGIADMIIMLIERVEDDTDYVRVKQDY